MTRGAWPPSRSRTALPVRGRRNAEDGATGLALRTLAGPSSARRIPSLPISPRSSNSPTPPDSTPSRGPLSIAKGMVRSVPPGFSTGTRHRIFRGMKRCCGRLGKNFSGNIEASLPRARFLPFPHHAPGLLKLPWSQLFCDAVPCLGGLLVFITGCPRCRQTEPEIRLHEVLRDPLTQIDREHRPSYRRRTLRQRKNRCRRIDPPSCVPILKIVQRTPGAV